MLPQVPGDHRYPALRLGPALGDRLTLVSWCTGHTPATARQASQAALLGCPPAQNAATVRCGDLAWARPSGSRSSSERVWLTVVLHRQPDG